MIKYLFLVFTKITCQKLCPTKYRLFPLLSKMYCFKTWQHPKHNVKWKTMKAFCLVCNVLKMSLQLLLWRQQITTFLTKTLKQGPKCKCILDKVYCVFINKWTKWNCIEYFWTCFTRIFCEAFCKCIRFIVDTYRICKMFFFKLPYQFVWLVKLDIFSKCEF